MNVSRRRFLSGAAAGAAGTALTAGILAEGAR
ncbi:twin-arginine translocation signal domain-containing protein, partial [Nocardia nova]|nr:twin-arginine translocation signal domain-containing protein [Nocardia nova]